MAKKAPKTQFFPYIGKAIPVIHQIAKEQFPGKSLGFVGHANGLIYMQERGNPEWLSFPTSLVDARM